MRKKNLSYKNEKEMATRIGRKINDNRVIMVIYIDSASTSNLNSFAKAILIIAGPEKAWINNGRI